MKLNKYISLEIILIVTGLVIGILWSQNPAGNFEPYVVIVTLILGAIEILRRKYKTSHDKKIEPNQTKHDISPITVDEIIEAINIAPPFQKNEVSKHYVGLKVNWTGYLKEAEQDYRDKNSVRVKLHIRKNEIIGNSIWFTENITKFPDIRSLNKKSEIRVLGEIISASGAGICVEVKPIKIDVLKRENA